MVSMTANTTSIRIPTDAKKNPSIEIDEMSAAQSINGSPSSLTHLEDLDLQAVRDAIGAPDKKTNKPPPGLYRTVLNTKKHASFRYFFLLSLYNFCVILQLLLGAVLTALAAVSSTNTDKVGLSVTVIAAANTVNAGIIALLHNSGFPQRLRSDMNEYSKVVEGLEMIMRTGVIKKGMTRDDVIQSAFDMYNQARATVEKNQPTYYVGTTPGAPGPAKATPPTDELV